EEVNGPLHGDATLARALCDRRRGIGADGLIIGSRPSEDVTGPGGRPIDVVMHLWNADGSRAEMSGNGIRCLGQALAMARDDHEATYAVFTDGGFRELVVHDDAAHRLATVSVTMGLVGEGPAVPPSVSERLGSDRHATADLGNPHLVVLVSDLSSVDLVGTGAWIESQFDAGINVEFIATGTEPDSLDLLVWERGAGVTEACGTGATAAATLAHQWGLVGREVRVVMPGGSAEVIVAPSPDAEPILIGPSQHIATLELPDA
ncbi:MAG TPA: diaminopimelate epimerase, partial [Acidimicrobiaceae bacterium]|nr:diaminopimelate epimerase [Acidimicrobiaceae bacterium]